MNESKNQSQTPRIDYDGRWKRIIELFFEQFVAFFMPELLPDVDFSQPPEFLEQELATIIPEQTAKGRMSVDKLLKIPMKNGEYEHVFLHVEVQSQRKADFTERNFKYFYRIFDSKGKAITAFVIYTNNDVFEPHDRYVYTFRGTKLVYEFNTYLVRDADEEELLKSDNIFALVVLACKYINRTKGDFELRRKFKLKLFRLSIERGYSDKYIKELLRFIGLLMYLPPEIEKEFEMDAKKEFKTTTLEKDVEGEAYLANLFDFVFEGEYAEDFKARTKAKVVEEVRAEVKEEVKAEVKEEVKAEVKEEVKAEVKEEVKAEVKEEVKAEVKEEQRKIRTESLRKLIISNVHKPSEIADIMGVTLDEVLKIKAEIDA